MSHDLPEAGIAFTMPLNEEAGMPFRIQSKELTLAALSLLYFLQMAGTFNSLGVVLPSMVKELGWTWGQAGMGFSLLGLACGFASLMPAVLIRKIGIFSTLIIGTAMLVAGFMCLAMTRGEWLYYLGAIVMGLGIALTTSVPGTYVLTSLFEKRSTALGVYFTMGNLGSVAGPLMFFGVTSIFAGWREYWFLLAAGTFVFGLLAAIVTGGQKKLTELEHHTAAAIEEKGEPWLASEALRKPQYYIIVGVYTVFLLINTTVHSFAVQHILERGMTMKWAGGLLSFEALVATGAGLVAGVVGERVDARWLSAAALAMMSLGAAALAFATSAPMLIFFATATGLAWGFSYVVTAVLLLNAFGRRANLELYSIMCLISTSAALGPLAGGVARDQSGDFIGVFMTCAIIGLIFVALVITMSRPIHASRAKSELALNADA